MATRRNFLLRIAGAIGASALLTGGARADGGHRLTLWQEGDRGERLVLRGRVIDEQRNPVAGAEVHVRHADGGGRYQYSRFQGVMVTDAMGRYQLRTVMPGDYGYARHIHMDVVHEQFAPTSGRILFKGDPGLGGAAPPNAILLEETRLDGDVVKIGNFDVMLRR